MQPNLIRASRGDQKRARDQKRVLNAGSGPLSARRLHPVFRSVDWREIRLDIDPVAKPDLVGTLTDLSALIPSQSFDAVWASHSLEHLHAHEAPLALSEFKRILKPDGFALITSPDLETVASLVVKHGLDHVAYQSPIGPITAHDILFGHTASIKRGMTFMAHKSGFTCESLGTLLLEAGFQTILVKRVEFDLWALALSENSDKSAIQQALYAGGLNMFDRAA
jgi:predicted SAM-dependent methyltransferase